MATASATPTSGRAPLTVNFTGSASGGTAPYTYSWTMGDGTSSTLQNPSATYAAGAYTATLTVADSAGRTATASVPIKSYGPLTATASASPAAGIAPLAVRFTATASGGSGGYTYSWNFGDGSAGSTTQDPSHSYATGTYTATVTVTDSIGDTATAVAGVSAYPALVATASATPTTGIAPLPVSFTGSASGGDGGPYSYSWSLGDGTTSTLQNPTDTYAAGSFTATLTVTDGSGDTASATVGLTVYAPLTVSASGTPTAGVAPLAVTFSSSASGGSGGYTYSWTFGDGASAATQNPTHSYSAGTYSATVTVTDSAGHTASAIVGVTSYAPVSVTASGTPTTGAAPLTVNFTGSASGGDGGPYTYRWDFGDGGTSALQNPSYSYAAGGAFTATLTVTDGSGNTGTATVAVSPMSASLAASPTSGNFPLPVSFTASAAGGSGTYSSYAFDFGDGATTSGTSATASHTYATFGTYTAKVTVTDSAGTAASATVTITVTIPPLTASAGASPTSGLAPLVTAFTGGASGGVAPYTYSWAFGDGGTSTAQNPGYTYPLPGTYTATLTVTDSESPAVTATATVTITVTQPAPAITGLSPNFGSESGGTTVTITGTYFESASAVHFGTRAASIVSGSLTCDSSGNCSIQAVSPAQAAGTIYVTVTTPAGTSPKQNDQYTYLMSWALAAPATSPSAREGAALAPLSSTDVLFGGDDGTLTLGDTWTWNGTAWTAGPVVGPSIRTNAAIAYYPDAGTDVLFGGCALIPVAGVCATPLADVWTWNGTAWTAISPSGTAPAARTGAALAYDPRNHRLIVFGGLGATGALGDTWALTYNTTSHKWAWSSPLSAGAAAPSARGYAAAGTDGSGQIVVFGGYSGTAVLGDTWLWTGSAWSLAPYGQTPAPSARQLASTGFFKNPNGGSASGLALFGGVNGAAGVGTAQSDTWTWNGTTWSLLPTSSSPSARYNAAAAEDTNGGVLLVGGNTGTGLSDETWRLS